MDKTDRLRDYGLAFLLYEQGLGICRYELIRELFIFVKLILNSYLSDLFSFTISLEYHLKLPYILVLNSKYIFIQVYIQINIFLTSCKKNNRENNQY